jgi:toxin ParE1/3/4
MRGVTFSRAAEADLQAIDDYTFERFGLRQAIETAATFELALTMLADNPRSGRLDERLSPPGRAFRFRVVLSSFVIVYEPHDRGIRVARILHAARDLPSVLLDDAGDE